MIRKRRRKKRREELKKRSQLALVFGGALLAALLAAFLPASCNSPVDSALEEQVRQRLDTLDRDSQRQGRR